MAPLAWPAATGRIHPGAHDAGCPDTYRAPMDERLAGGRYEIEVGAALDSDCGAWFDGFEVVGSGDVTVLRGVVADQSALHGVLARLRDLAIPLLGVRRIEELPDPDGIHRSGRNAETKE